MPSPSIGNLSFAAFRSALNNILEKLDIFNAGDIPPVDFQAYSWWLDTSSSPPVLRIRNAANSAWVDLFSLINLSELKNALATIFTGGSHSGIEYSYNPTTGLIDSTVTLESQQITRGETKNLSGNVTTLSGIPPGVDRVTILINNASFESGGSNWAGIRLNGEGSGYDAKANLSSNESSSSNTARIAGEISFDSSLTGQVTITRFSGNTWIFAGICKGWVASGKKTTTSELNLIQFVGERGLDGGQITVFWE